MKKPSNHKLRKFKRRRL